MYNSLAEIFADPSDRLMPFQETSVDFVNEKHHSIIAHDPGLGKTAIACRSLISPAIVISPASLIINWRRELTKWRRDLTVDDVQIISYANPRLRKILNRADYHTLVCDEVHYIKTPDAKRTRAVCRGIRRAKKAIVISGTLVPNRPIELWPIMFTMGITDMKYEKFAYRYADAYTNEFGVLDVRGNSNLDELRELLEPYCIRFTKKQVLPQLPPKTWRVISLDLPLSQEDRVRPVTLDNLKRMSTEVAFESMSDILHMHGLFKLPAVISYIDDILHSQHKIILFAHHRDVLDGLMEAMTKRGMSPVMVRGGMSPKKKQAAVDRFQTDPTCRILAGQIQAAGVGLTMTASSYVIFVEGSWVPAVMEQASDRAHRIGTKNNVTCDVLTISRTIDEHMMRRCVEKQEVLTQIVPLTEYVSNEISLKVTQMLS